MVETVININDGQVNITAAGGETSLAADFPIYEKSHVTIKRTRSGVQTTGVLNTDYTIADNQLEVTAGFTAVLAGTWTPAAAGDTFVLLLDVPEARTSDFTQAGDFFAATLNRELDLYAQMSQQLRRDSDKAVRLSDASTAATPTLSDATANAYLLWNAAGTGITNSTILSTATYSEKTANYTIGNTTGVAEANTLFGYNNSSGGTFTVPANATTAFPLGTYIGLFQKGAGQLTIAAAGGVTIYSEFSRLKLFTQYSFAVLQKIATNEWILIGSLTA